MWLEFALGVLRWSPDEFWRATLYEASCAYVGFAQSEGIGPWAKNEHGWTDAEIIDFREEIEAMKRRFPDKVKSKRRGD